MSYVKKVLLPDEKIVYMGMLHWVVFLPGLGMILFGGTLGLCSYSLAGLIFGEGQVAYAIGRSLAGIGLIASVVGLVVSSGAWIRQSSTELAITNKRFIAKYGFIARMTSEIMINRVTGVNFEQSVWGRILGFGTILVHGQGGDISPFDKIADPKAFQHAIMRVLETAGAAKV